MESIIDMPPNTGPKMTEIWAFVSRDQQGRENVCGASLGAPGSFDMQPLMSGNPKIIEIMKPIAKVLQQHLPAGRTIHLLRFTNREEIQDW